MSDKISELEEVLEFFRERIASVEKSIQDNTRVISDMLELLNYKEQELKTISWKTSASM